MTLVVAAVVVVLAVLHALEIATSDSAAPLLAMRLLTRLVLPPAVQTTVVVEPASPERVLTEKILP